ncbi:hypothetical protein I302_104877 [Kwoniella bestiolae CBS 10118]|uniref:Ribosomal protein L10 n=1 Tax=Kwoniella bestiolae CBS 10118 TaxID=1296100 RepID=A0A1B9FRI0_9TREE|nr:hypothetical protein I302_09052 [Kwoniella bestiolae CBS 10118]OCF21375.1 hypothetical protein I302_09052 [Kwoniella bestiolae CBS 10118]
MPPRPSTSIRALTSTRFASTSSLPLTPSTPSSSSSTPPPADPNRIYTARKTFLWNYYTHLIDNSNLVLVYDHSNLTAGEWSKIRRSISSIPLPSKPYDPSTPTPSSEQPETIDKASINVVRTGVLASLLSKSNSPLTTTPSKEGEQILVGQRALLTCPSLSPTYLNKILSTLNRTLKGLKRENTADEKQPSLKLISGLLEHKHIYTEQQLQNEIAKLPELDVLRSQLVGLLQAPQSQLVGVLNQARGGQLVRTLQGLEESLKGDSNGGEEQKSA